MTLRVGSLFSGIGGFDLGLERTGGFTTAWFCEQDEFCQHVLAKHWPGVPCHSDITELRGADVESVDVLCGGFPCQDLSVAGRGAGLAGARSGLWSEYARLIGELGPRYVLVENVSALLARGLGVVLADLAALGYDAEWDCIPASAVGAPHQRDRIWLVAYPQRQQLRQQPVAIARRRSPALAGIDGSAQRMADAAGDRRGEGRARRPAGDGPDRQDVKTQGVADADDPGRIERRRPEPVRAEQPASERRREALADTDGMAGTQTVAGDRGCREVSGPGTLERALRCRGGVRDQWGAEPDVGRVADGVPARVDRLRSLGNALVPQIATWIGQRVLDYENGVTSVAA